jgi:hypothetical protein
MVVLLRTWGVFFAVILTILYAKDKIPVLLADSVTLPLDQKTQMPIYDVNSTLLYSSPEFMKTVGEYPYILTGGRMAGLLSRNLRVVENPNVKNAKQIEVEFLSETAYIPTSCMEKIQADYIHHEQQVFDKLASYRKSMSTVKYEIIIPDRFSIKTSCPKVAFYKTNVSTSEVDDIDFSPKVDRPENIICIIEKGRWNNSCSETKAVYKSIVSWFSGGITSYEIKQPTSQVNPPESNNGEAVEKVEDNHAVVTGSEIVKEWESVNSSKKTEVTSNGGNVEPQHGEVHQENSSSEEQEKMGDTDNNVSNDKIIDKQQRAAQCVLTAGC